MAFLIDRAKFSNVRAFLTMNSHGECGWKYDFMDESGKYRPGPEGSFTAVVPRELQEEIKSRVWGDPMSGALKIFTALLWARFIHEVAPSKSTTNLSRE